MTLALCLNCGAVKFGAICPCPKCSVASSGNMQLDIAFSDHHLPLEKLKELGDVVRRIGKVCGDDAKLRGMSFMGYVTEHEPGILRINLAPDDAARVKHVLAELDQVGPVADDDDQLANRPSPPGRPRRWWQFWRS